MKFFEVLKRRKILFLNIFLFLYIAINLFSGDRGLFSYFEKKDLEKNLHLKKISLNEEITEIENKNLLLSENLNFDFIDILIRKKLMFGNKDEILIKFDE
tara:strand:- start:125 stop:424 length:300 start_codon:yes stop_codon:yes gene_type:complete